MEILAVIKHFLLDEQAQVKFYRYVSQIDNLDRNQAELLKHIDDLYQLFPEKGSISQTEILTYIQQRNPTRDITVLRDLVTSAMEQDIGTEVTQTLLEAVIERHQCAKLAVIAGAVISNQVVGKQQELMGIMEDWEDMVQVTDRPDALQECDMSYSEAIKYRATDSGIKWPLTVLNKCIGGVEPSLGLVIARPDTGKTSFILNCLAYWAAQIQGTGRNLLYCGNEEQVIGLKARCGVSLLGWDTDRAEQDPDVFGQKVTQHGGDSIRFHGGVRSTKDVELLLKRYDPVVVVADQIGKFRLPGRAQIEGPAQLAEVYGWFRDKAGEYGTMVMGVAQADATGHNKQWLSFNQINASKTDVPGELDWGIGIGMLEENGMEFTRFINIFKNKQKYGVKGRDQVTFNPMRCRYKG